MEDKDLPGIEGQEFNIKLDRIHWSGPYANKSEWIRIELDGKVNDARITTIGNIFIGPSEEVHITIVSEEEFNSYKDIEEYR